MMITANTYPYQTNVVSQKQYDAHIKLYRGYVDKVNEITDKLQALTPPIAANATYSLYRGLKKGETYALDGVMLHEAYFQNMTNQATSPDEATMHIIKAAFGSFDKWQDDFTNCAKSARGWCVFAYEQRTNSFRNLLQDSHDDGVVCLAYPLIVLDMYEHAYFLDYATDKDAYIKKFMAGISWETVGKRVQKLNIRE